MSAQAIHSMIRVLDEQRTVAFYGKAFGLEVVNRYPMDSSTIVYLRNQLSPFEVELTINGDRSEPYDTGDGYGHLAVRVDDLDAEHARMSRDGLEPGEIKELDLGGTARFFFLKDPGKYGKPGKRWMPIPKKLQISVTWNAKGSVQALQN